MTQPDSIPAELATALISAGGMPGDPQILVGSLPGWLTSRLYVPSMWRVLGSAFIGTSAVAVVSSPDMPEAVIATLKRELSTRGWKAPPPQPSYGGGGFRPSVMQPNSPESTTRLTLCGDQQILSASATRRRGVTTDIVMRVSTASNYSSCNPPPMPAGMPRSPYPTLFNPPNANEQSSACGNDFFGSSGTGTTVRLPMTSAALLDHYARQLQDSGWHAPSDSGSIVGRTWTKTDSAGAPVELTITVTSAMRDPSCRTLNLTVRTLRKP